MKNKNSRGSDGFTVEFFLILLDRFKILYLKINKLWIPYWISLCEMVGENEIITGIKINGKEFRLSQYADDTQLFLDGTEQSLT